MKRFLLLAVVIAASVGLPLPAVGIPRAYVTSCQDGTVSVLDTATDTVTATIPSGLCPVDAAVLPDGSRAYVAPYYDSDFKLFVIDTQANAVVATVPISSGFHPVATHPAGRRVYVGTSSGVFVVDVATNPVHSGIT